jgi:hypothetical protein
VAAEFCPINRATSVLKPARRQRRRSGAINSARRLDVRAQMICAHLLARSAFTWCARSADLSQFALSPIALLGCCTRAPEGALTAGPPTIPKHSMCEDLLVWCADNHVVCEASVHEQGGP